MVRAVETELIFRSNNHIRKREAIVLSSGVGKGGQWPLQYLERGPDPPGVTIMKCTYISTDSINVTSLFIIHNNAVSFNNFVH